MSDTLRNIIILLCIVLVGMLGWYMFDQNRQMQLQVTSGTGTSIQAETQEFIQKQNLLGQLSIESELFQDQTFLNLIDISTPVPTFPVGRNNLFSVPF